MAVQEVWQRRRLDLTRKVQLGLELGELPLEWGWILLDEDMAKKLRDYGRRHSSITIQGGRATSLHLIGKSSEPPS